MPRFPRPSRKTVLIASAVLGAIVLAIPWVLAKTSLRDWFLSSIAGRGGLVVESRDASFGYVAPLSLSGLRVYSPDRVTQIEIEHIQAERSWLRILFAIPDLGDFQFHRPSVDVFVEPSKIKPFGIDAEEQNEVMQTDTPEIPGPPLNLPQLSASVREASVRVRTSIQGEPPIDLDRVSVSIRIEERQDGSLLWIQPATIFDHQPITPELCRQGLQLIAPLLADEISAEGEFSLRLDQFELPLGPDIASSRSDMNIRGELELHHASVGLRNTVAGKVIGAVLARLFGSDEGTPSDQKLTVAQNVSVGFHVADGRFYHEGLALLLPRGDSAVRILSGGSVGLDETLDLHVSIFPPDDLLARLPAAQTWIAEGVVLRVTGTMDEPRVDLADRPQLSGGIDAAGDILGGLLERIGDREKPLLRKPLFQKLRDRFRREQGDAPEEPMPNSRRPQIEL